MRQTASEWRVLGASVTGTSHRTSGRGCDDAHAYRRVGDATLLLAVADGSGSASRSAEGAACVLSTTVKYADAALAERGEPADSDQWRRILRTILKEARAGLESLSKAKATVTIPLSPTDQPIAPPLGEYATTLLVAIVSPN